MTCLTVSKTPTTSHRSVRRFNLTGTRSIFPKTKKGYLTYVQALTETQASEAELTRALKDRRILLINGNLSFQSRQGPCPDKHCFVGTLRPIASSYLSTILELLLNSLVSLQQEHDSASLKLLADTLQGDHDIRPQVTKQVMGWFGDVDEHHWRMDIPSVLKQVGMGILRTYRVRRVLRTSLKPLTHKKHDPIDEDKFLDKWKNAVGDTFASQVDLSLLSVRPSRSLFDSSLLIVVDRETISHQQGRNHNPFRTS